MSEEEFATTAPLPASGKPTRKSSVLRGVGVGAGYFSQFHYEAWNRLDSVQLSAVCDLHLDRAKEVAKRFDIQQVYKDVADMLDREQPDFVDIITRPDSHLELVRMAAERNVAVICQKPLAPSIAEARQLVALAEESGIRLMVHENFRFQPWHRKIKQLLDQGVIGHRLHSLSCRTRLGDGWPSDAYLARQPYFVTMPQLLVFETGVHFIDTFRCLAGEIEGVYASLRRLNSNIAGEDEGLIVFEFSNGARGVWDASRFNESNCEDPRYTFGYFLLEGDKGTIRLYEHGRITIQLLGGKETEVPYAHHRINFAGDCVFTTQQHFIECLFNDQPFETSGREYLKTLQVQSAVYESARAKLPVRGIGSNPTTLAVGALALEKDFSKQST